ncbi:MAG: hypothetical protein M3Q39_14165 [Actinomycetota bacterium]|nr:hypothetical protein [Actinomycetota bacterium]
MTGTNGVPSERSRYLLDGRRASVKDLLDARLIRIGDRLRFARPRKDALHTAVVVDGGRIAIDPDGDVFGTPSKAAAAAAGMRAVDGWRAWIVESTGTTLDVLRGRLLDAVAADSGPPLGGEHAEPPQPWTRHEFLKEARGRADGETPVTVAVRDLLSLWDSRARGRRISERIEADLDNHGLITAPDFRRVTLDSKVSLVGAAVPEEIEPETPDGSEETSALPDERDIGLTLGNLPSALGGVESVTPHATFEQAITAMLLNDFSQLPVLATKHTVRGAVTWKSIAKARHANPDADFASAIIAAEPEPYDRELFEVLPRLATDEFVIVKDDRNVISGIVTTTDVVNLYGELSTPFLLIGELDQELRQLISSRFDIDEICAVCDPDGTRGIESYDDLSIGGYEQILKNKDSWAKLGWPLDRVMFTNRLADLREVRNDIMHFNPDPLPPDTVQKLRHFLALLRTYAE